MQHIFHFQTLRAAIIAMASSKAKCHFICNSKTFLHFFVVFFSNFILSTCDYPGINHCKAPGLVALTFDDGPSPNGGTKSVLDVLHEKNAKATFFVTGKGHDSTLLDSDERKQNLLREIYAEGHQIGSHTWSHPNLVRNRTREQIHRDISHLAQTVHYILGINMTVLRPPYGYTNDTVVDLIQEEFGYKVVRWNLDTKDWYHRKNIEASFKHYETAMEGDGDDYLNLNSTNSFITLHHDPVARSGELASRAIDFVRSKGFKLVTVGECIGVPDYQ